MIANALRFVFGLLVLLLAHGPAWCAVNEGKVKFYASKCQELAGSPFEDGGTGRPRYPISRYNDHRKKQAIDYCEAALKYRKDAPEIQFRLARAYSASNKSAPAFEMASKAAHAGYAPAQHLTSTMFLEGTGVAKDAVRSYEWLLKAANQGYAPSIYRLGHYYWKGIVVTKDEAKAITLFKQLGAEKFGPALGMLGYLHHTGRGVEKDQQRALQFYREGAASGDGFSKTKLAIFYLDGKMLKKDEARAQKLFYEATLGGYDPAYIYLGDLKARRFLTSPARWNDDYWFNAVITPYFGAENSKDPTVARLGAQRAATLKAARAARNPATWAAIGVIGLVIAGIAMGPGDNSPAASSSDPYDKRDCPFAGVALDPYEYAWAIPLGCR